MQGPDCHPHLLLTLEYVQHQDRCGGRERGEAEGTLQAGAEGCTAVTTRLQGKRQSQELAQTPKEKNMPMSVLTELTKP